MGQGLALVSIPLVPLVLISAADGTIEQEAVEMGLMDEVQVCKVHEVVSDVPFQDLKTFPGWVSPLGFQCTWSNQFLTVSLGRS